MYPNLPAIVVPASWVRRLLANPVPGWVDGWVDGWVGGWVGG